MEGGLACIRGAAIKAPLFSGPSGFRAYKLKVAIWREVTTLPKRQQAGTMLESLGGTAERLALTISPVYYGQDNGADLLLNLLSRRLAGQRGASSMASHKELEASRREGRSMEYYLVAFNEVVSYCEEAGCPVAGTTAAHFSLDHAGLTDDQENVVMEIASNAPGTLLTFQAIAEALLAMYGGVEKVQNQALVSTPAARRPQRAAGSPRGGTPHTAPAPGGAASSKACWYCHKVGHDRQECNTRARHLRESCNDAVSVAARAASQDEVIHMMALAGISDASWDTSVGLVIVNPGVTATVVSADWATRYVASLTPGDRETVVEVVTSARLKFGTGDDITVTTELVLPLRVGSKRH